MSILVTGGIGFVGTPTVARLVDSGESVVVIDHADPPGDGWLPDGVMFYKVSVGKRTAVAEILSRYPIDTCMHFAALTSVGGSMHQPVIYFENNVAQTIALVDVLVKRGVDRFVFSSSAAVYGAPEEVPIAEETPHRPTSPYGAAKSVIEQMLAQLDLTGRMRSVSLRYFNAAGSVGNRPERHDPETHLIPLVIDAALGRRPALTVFGADYPTEDGSAVRDYIHVDDIAAAHVKALDYLRRGGRTEVFNLGLGMGHSVREVIESVQRVTGRRVPFVLGDRRPGDPPVLVAAPDRARAVLGWTPEHVDLDGMVADAWRSRSVGDHSLP